MIRLFSRPSAPPRQRWDSFARALESLGVAEDDPDLGGQLLASAAAIRARAKPPATPGG